MTRNEAGIRFSSLTSTSTDSTLSRSPATVRPPNNTSPVSRKSSTSMRLKTEVNGSLAEK
ncbi:hypothetical protein CGRA01v4_05723 [Colletotrichum graminicola]|uniref:Uncharacterized protein n=1 Tax=Colletotrichum graminicola (strain M1.001 / M2 / FGSC 10212) TaxID=645133 RepID=E3Q5R8_COLGM|nr:uncharacterized protein GLRG_01703 [Colletotrichum graminicola M1.001]EFQ26559.1 hypothetical protein GLRG_01703 [Colletotrichum graminicola M1.001]WDK14442.1 hypothetical protein CGRA01v4_05723 [Colletotrichum graminicola]